MNSNRFLYQTGKDYSSKPTEAKFKNQNWTWVWVLGKFIIGNVNI